jgi:hypothetical protein
MLVCPVVRSTKYTTSSKWQKLSSLQPDDYKGGSGPSTTRSVDSQVLGEPVTYKHGLKHSACVCRTELPPLGRGGVVRGADRRSHRHRPAASEDGPSWTECSLSLHRHLRSGSGRELCPRPSRLTSGCSTYGPKRPQDRRTEALRR